MDWLWNSLKVDCRWTEGVELLKVKQGDFYYKKRWFRKVVMSCGSVSKSLLTWQHVFFFFFFFFFDNSVDSNLWSEGPDFIMSDTICWPWPIISLNSQQCNNFYQESKTVKKIWQKHESKSFFLRRFILY